MKIMIRKKQDKRWNELSEESKKKVKENYNAWLTDTIFSEDFKNRAIALFHSEYGSHNLQPKLTYEDVARELFPENRMGITDITFPVFSETHAGKLCAMNALICVAKFLNKNEDGSDWVPYWKCNNRYKWYIFIDRDGDVHVDEVLDDLNSRIVYFRTEAIAKQCVEILGEETIRTALGNY